MIDSAKFYQNIQKACNILALPSYNSVHSQKTVSRQLLTPPPDSQVINPIEITLLEDDIRDAIKLLSECIEMFDHEKVVTES